MADAMRGVGKMGGGGILGGAPQGTTPAMQALCEGMTRLASTEYQIEQAHPAGMGPVRSAEELVDRLAKGFKTVAKVRGKSNEWPIQSVEKLAEFVFAEIGEPQHLSEDVQRQLSLIQRLKDSRVRFFGGAGWQYGIKPVIGPLWKLREGSLYAEHPVFNNGSRARVTNLETLAQQIGVNLNAPAPPPPAVIAPTAAAPQPPPPPVAEGVPPPPVFPGPAATEPQVEAPVAGTTKPPAETSPAPPQAPPGPAVTVRTIEEVKAEKAVEEAKVVEAPKPPEAPKVTGGVVAADAVTGGIPPLPADLLGTAIIADAVNAEAKTSRAKKVKAVGDDTISVISEKMLFVLPPGKERLTSVVPKTGSSKQKDAVFQQLTKQLSTTGVPFIFMSVVAPTEGRLEAFKKEHPIIAKLIADAATGGAAGTDGAVKGAKGKGDKTRTQAILFALMKDYKQHGELSEFPPTEDMARALAVADVPVALVRLVAPNGEMLKTLQQYVQANTGQKGAKEPKEQPAA